MRRGAEVVVLLALLSLGPPGCRREAPGSVPPEPPPSATAPPAPESPRLHDPRWLEARGDDPLEKARLAVAVGAAELLAGADDEDRVADTALAALPYADDAQIALGRLGDLALDRASPRGTARRRRVLEAILGIAGQPRRPTEPLDPEGARRCGRALLALAADRALPRDERALAVSAARALAEHGYVDRRGIPTDLDPK
jgi:hypothetical protein